VETYYLVDYLAAEGIDSGWTGDHNSCAAGSTAAEFQEAVLRRINYFRAMAGVPAIEGFLAEYNAKAQAAALMMSANDMLSHSPDSSWLCYTEEGRQGAGSSNLFLGVYGPSAISGYMYDPGDGNYFVGHRRWILYPQSRFLGTGDIPPTAGYAPANALWVFDQDNMWGPRPETRDEFVAWPPAGYVPSQVVFPRWSFAYAEADLADATVTMTGNGQPLAVAVREVVNGFGENTLVWEPEVDFSQPPASDTIYQVSINQVVIEGTPATFAYTVIVFEANP
jgi:hypothetical protein